MTAPVILAVAPNGARRTTSDHPHLPLTTEAIAHEVATCTQAGASMVHLHVRDRAGNHSLDPGRYREAIDAIHERTGGEILIQITTESVGRYSPEAQRACVRALMPASVSLALRELAPNADEAHATGHLLWELLEANVIPQLILYRPEELDHYRTLQATGVFPVFELPLLFVLGSHDHEQPQATLSDFLAGPVGPACWMVCGFGKNELPVVKEALRRGGQARVGFENNLWHPRGDTLRDNAESVALAAAAARALGRTPASPTVCRTLLMPEQQVREAVP